MTKLLKFYSNYLSETRDGMVSNMAHAIPQQLDMRVDGQNWIDEVSCHYSNNTLERLLSSLDARTRRAAAWALQHHGTVNNCQSLGRVLSDHDYYARRAADRAKRAIVERSLSPIQRSVVSKIEEFFSEGKLEEAERLCSLLINESGERSDIYSLRASIRLAQGKVHDSADDCKQSIRIDKFAYHSFVALGQCYWHQLNNGAAKECYLEAARIFPDCRTAHAGIEFLAGQT